MASSVAASVSSVPSVVATVNTTSKTPMSEFSCKLYLITVKSLSMLQSWTKFAEKTDKMHFFTISPL